MIKRIISTFLTLCIVLLSIPFNASAVDIVETGTCGENVFYALDSTGLLTISGTGAMMNYTDSERSPFYRKDAIRSVVIESGVTTIGDMSFFDCTHIETLIIPQSVESIGYAAFFGCNNLNAIDLPVSVMRLGDAAFVDCRKLEMIAIPSGVTNIGERTFSGCKSLKELRVSQDNSAYSSKNGVLFDKAQTTLVKFPQAKSGDYSIPSSVTSIGNYAFEDCANLSNVIIPDSVTLIGDYAFQRCYNLGSIEIPNGVTSISDSLFHECTSLSQVTLPDSLLSIGSHAFNYCENLTCITIPSRVNNIGSFAFFGCGLTSIIIPPSVINIGEYAFCDCTRLRNAIISPNVTSIENAVFRNCTNLKNVVLPTNITEIGYLAFCECRNLNSISIPSNVVGIAQQAFYNCSSLHNVFLPMSLRNIGAWAFTGCSSLKDVYYSGGEMQWKNINFSHGSEPLKNAAIHFNAISGENSNLSIKTIFPNHSSVGKDAQFDLVFNQEVEFGKGYLEIRNMDTDSIVGQFVLSDYANIASINGNIVTIDISRLELPDGWYSASIGPQAFQTKSGEYYLGMPNNDYWQFEVCSYIGKDGIWKYDQKGHYFWKSDDTTKPAIPNGSDSAYASILMSWFDQYGLQSISKQELLSELSEPMYFPVTDVNGSTVLLNDKSTTVKQTLEDILFLESLKPFAMSIDSKLSTIEKWEQDSVMGYFSPLRQERTVYKEVLGWYPQVDEYLSKRNGNSNLFYSADAPLAYLFILTGAEDAGGMFFQYSKPFLKAQLDSSILQSSLNGLSQYKNYGDFKTAVTDGKASIKGLKAIYTAYSEGAPAGAKAIIKFGSDLLQTYFKDSNNSTLKDIGEAWSDYDTAMGAGELCAFLGGSIGAFPMVIELYDDLFTKVKDSVAAGYFIGDYYVAEKYPGLYDAIYDDETTFPEYSVYKMTESDYISTIDGDPILHNWCEYLSRITEGAMRDDCRQLRFDLVNYIMLLKYAQEFDVDAAKEAFVKYISAECNQQKTTELYASCPVTVEVYSKENDQLVATLSSEDEDIFSCEYGSLYLMGEDNETKCFVLNSSDYYASILPYADGTMDVAVVSTDENGLPVGKTFSDVALRAGSTFKLDLDDMDSGLQTQNGDIIEKESTVPVQRINISGKSEVAVDAKSTLSAEVLPEIASEKRLIWTSADTSIATVDNNGTITGVAFGETVITATSADGVTEDFAISVFVPSTELHVDKTQLRMVKGESFTLHASTTEGATHSVRWKSNNLNSVVVSANGVLTAKEAGDAIVTASIDGKEAEVLIVVSDESLDVMMYQTDLGGNALHLAMANPSCEKSLSGSAYVAVYESGRMIDLKEISIDLESNQEKTEMIALPDFSAEKTYSAVFYPLGDIAQDMQPEEIVFVNGSYELKDSTEAASSELTECQKVTVTYDNAQPGVGYTLYVLSDNSGVPTNENIVFMGHKIAENNNLTFTVCPSEEYQDKECYVYVSDAESELHYLSSISGLGHKTELSGVKEATCTTDGYSGDEICTICGEIVKQGAVIKATGHKWDSGEVTKEPTENAEGIKTFTCTVCGETKTEAIPKLTHTHNYTDVVTPPTCTEQGYTTHTCTGCGESYVDSYVDALGHKTELRNAKAATCTADGYTGDEICSTCGETIRKGTVIKATGHKWDSGKVTKEPTEAAEGVKTFTCTVCGETRTEAIPKLTPVTPPAPNNPFVDVKQGAYYYDPVLWAVNHQPQITNGTSATTFSPDATCTRGQVVTFLWRAMGQPEPTSMNTPFTDVPSNEYYHKAVLWAVEKGITNGTSPTTFSPNAPCTRAHVVTFLWRAEGQPVAGSSNPFSDVPSGQYYTSAVLWAVSKNITNGTSATTFSPDAPCTRGQIVTFLYRDMK